MTLESARSISIQRVGLEDTTLTETISGTELFIGAHLPDGSKTPCRQVSMNFEHLADWALPDGGFSQYGSLEATDGGQLEHFAFNLPDPVEFQAFGADIRINYGSDHQDGHHSFSIQRPVRLIATFPEPLPYARTYDEIVKPLQYFLTFACAAPTQLLDLEFAVDGLERQVSETLSIPTWIETAHHGWREPNLMAQPFWEMLLPLRMMKDRVEDIFRHWSEIMERGASAIDLLASLTLGPPLYLETRYLFAIQSIEAYSRRRFENAMIDPDAHEKRKATVLAGLPDDKAIRSWIKELLHWSNEPELRGRLETIIAYSTPPARDLLRENYVQLAVRTRNWFTHYSEELEPKAASGEDLYWLTEETIVLMECCLLHDLGFDGVEAGKLLEATRRAKAVFNTKQMRGT
jgi:hypothetical protein